MIPVKKNKTIVLGSMCMLVVICFTMITLTSANTAPAADADQVEVHCIEDYRIYCANKKHGFKFSDGCRDCICGEHEVKCRKGGCHYTALVTADPAAYCEQVMTLNANKLEFYLASKKFENKYDSSEWETGTHKHNKNNHNEIKVERQSEHRPEEPRKIHKPEHRELQALQERKSREEPDPRNLHRQNYGNLRPHEPHLFKPEPHRPNLDFREENHRQINLGPHGLGPHGSSRPHRPIGPHEFIGPHRPMGPHRPIEPHRPTEPHRPIRPPRPIRLEGPMETHQRGPPKLDNLFNHNPNWQGHPEHKYQREPQSTKMMHVGLKVPATDFNNVAMSPVLPNIPANNIVYVNAANKTAFNSKVPTGVIVLINTDNVIRDTTSSLYLRYILVLPNNSPLLGIQLFDDSALKHQVLIEQMRINSDLRKQLNKAIEIVNSKNTHKTMFLAATNMVEEANHEFRENKIQDNGFKFNIQHDLLNELQSENHHLLGEVEQLRHKLQKCEVYRGRLRNNLRNIKRTANSSDKLISYNFITIMHSIFVCIFVYKKFLDL